MQHDVVGDLEVVAVMIAGTVHRRRPCGRGSQCSTNPHRFRNRGLRHPTLAQQYHLDARAPCRGYFPPQRRFQFPDLPLAALDHPPLRIRSPKRTYSTLECEAEKCRKSLDSISDGTGITTRAALTLGSCVGITGTEQPLTIAAHLVSRRVNKTGGAMTIQR